VKWSQSGRNKSDYGGKDLWKRWVLSLEWKVEAVIGDESEGGDCDEVICAGWGKSGREWTEWGWRNEEGSWTCSLSLRVAKVTWLYPLPCWSRAWLSIPVRLPSRQPLRFRHLGNNIPALVATTGFTPLHVISISCKSSKNVIRQVFCGLPLSLRPLPGTQSLPCYTQCRNYRRLIRGFDPPSLYVRLFVNNTVQTACM